VLLWTELTLSIQKENKMSSKTQNVKFKAHEKVKEPARVSFKTKDGEKVRFTAEKTVKVPVTVSFTARKKKK
jgi:hypothetical protein